MSIKAFISLSLLLSSSFTFSQSSLEDKLFVDLIVGIQQLEDGDYNKALKTFNNVISKAEKASITIDKSIAEVYLHRAEASIKLKQFNNVCNDLEKAVSFGFLEAYELAKSRCEALVTKIESNNLLSAEIGNKLFWDKEYKKAIPYFSKAIAQKPYDVLTMGSRAMCYSFIGQLDSALLDYNKILKLESDNPDRYADRGSVLFKMGKFEESLVDLNRAVEADPQNEIYLMAQGKTFRALKKYEESISCYNKLIEKLPWGEFYLERAKCYLGLEDKVNACKDLMKIEEADKTEEVKELLKTCGQ